MKWIVEDFSDIAFIKMYQNCLLFLIGFFIFIALIFKSVIAFLVPIEFMFFFTVLSILIFFIVLISAFLVEARSKLKGLDAKKTLKYTEFLQRRLKRSVASGVATDAESVQVSNSKKLNWLAKQSYVMADKKGQLAVVIRIGSDVELVNEINKEMVDGILSYFAKISDTRFSKSELVTIEHSVILKNYTTDYPVARLLK